jgi:hypothetical protein
MGAAIMPARRGIVGALGAAAVGIALTVVLAACSNGGAKPTAATGTAGSAAGSGASTASGAGSTASGSDAAAAFRACLQQHGVTLPSFSQRPGAGSGRPRPTGTFSRPAGGFSRPPGSGGGSGFGGFGGFGGSANPSQQAALQACASLRPSGAAGFGFGRGGAGPSISATTFASFKSCMAGNGVTITQTDPITALRSLNRGDATTAAALKICDPILGAAADVGAPRASGSPASS